MTKDSSTSICYSFEYLGFRLNSISVTRYLIHAIMVSHQVAATCFGTAVAFVRVVNGILDFLVALILLSSFLRPLWIVVEG